ncbi:ATP-dependent Clp protease proteolytic subunit [Patescibacteria group bacterium]
MLLSQNIDKPEMIMDWKDFRTMARDLVNEKYIPVFGHFCNELEQVVVECILLAKKKGYEEMTFLINSNGGWNDAFTGIKSMMVITEIKFTGFVTSRARSNGFRLLQHCHRRLAVRNSELLFHWGQTRLDNNEIAALMNGQTWPTEHVIKIRDAIVQEIHERTDVPMKNLYEFALYDRPFTAEEGLALNFLDEIVEDTPQLIKKALSEHPDIPSESKDKKK